MSETHVYSLHNTTFLNFFSVISEINQNIFDKETESSQCVQFASSCRLRTARLILFKAIQYLTSFLIVECLDQINYLSTRGYVSLPYKPVYVLLSR